MTKYIFSKVSACIIVTVLSAAFQLKAEEPNTPSSLERVKMESLWFGNTSNAAGAYIDQIKTYSQFNFYFDREGGNFKRTQTGSTDMKIGFNTDGGGINQKVGGIFLWGRFDYYRNHIKGTRFNASLIDPYRGTSFYIADPDISNWVNHKYDMAVKVSTPKIFDFLIFGLDASYQSDMASKQLDARGNFYAAELQITPGLALTFGDHAVGLDFEYIKRRETSRSGLTVGYSSLGVAEMQFPGFFKRNEMGGTGGSNTERDFRSHSLGGGAQYNYNGEIFKLLLSGNYAQMVESAFMSYTDNQQAGSNIFRNYNAKLNAIYGITPSSSLFFNAEYSHRDIETLDITQEYDNTLEVQKWITKNRSRRGNVASDNMWASLEYMIKKDNSYSWLAGVKGRYEKLYTEYYTPFSTEKVNSIYADIYLKKNFIFNDRNSFMAGINAGIKNVKDKSHDYQPYYPDNVFYKEFTLVDYAYLSSGYCKGGLELSYTYSGIFKEKGGALYISAMFDYIKARKSDPELFKDRTLCNVKIGMVF